MEWEEEFKAKWLESAYPKATGSNGTGVVCLCSNSLTLSSRLLLPNPVIAESALDRLISSSHIITLIGKNYRSMLRSDKALEKEADTM